MWLCEDTGFTFLFLSLTQWAQHIDPQVMDVRYIKVFVLLVWVDFNDLLSIKANPKSLNIVTFNYVCVSRLQSVRWKPNTLILSWFSAVMVSTFLSVACFDVCRWSCYWERESLSDLPFWLLRTQSPTTDACYLSLLKFYENSNLSYTNFYYWCRHHRTGR